METTVSLVQMLDARERRVQYQGFADDPWGAPMPVQAGPPEPEVAPEDDEYSMILGPSGSGKSTFLRLINQLETLTGGSRRHGLEEGRHSLLRRFYGYDTRKSCGCRY